MQIFNYSDKIEVGPNYTQESSAEIFSHSNRIQFTNVEESSTSVVGDKHPAIWSLIRDRAMKMS